MVKEKAQEVWDSLTILKLTHNKSNKRNFGYPDLQNRNDQDFRICFLNFSICF